MIGILESKWSILVLNRVPCLVQPEAPKKGALKYFFSQSVLADIFPALMWLSANSKGLPAQPYNLLAMARFRSHAQSLTSTYFLSSGVG